MWSNSATSQTIVVTAGTYIVTVSDANGCIATSSVVVTENQLSTISGIVQYSGGTLAPYKASVKLYSTNQPDSISGSTLINNVLTGSDSKFYFNNVAIGEYIIKAETIDNTYPTIISTYYDTTLLSQYAIKLNAECGVNQDIVVNMKELQTSNSGTSSITGKITVASNNKSIMGEPIPGAEITLEQEPDDEPIANTESNGNGDYTFNNLANAEYSIIVDIPGFPQLETHTIVVNGDTSNINYVVDTDTSSSTFGIYIDSATSIIKYSFKNFSVNVYPNPFKNQLNFDFNLEQNSDVNIEIIDISGKKVETLMNKKLSKGNYNNSYQLDNIVDGIYLIKMKVGDTVLLKKVLKN
ncbi:MAG: hypothetical protein A2046_14410 [Bacteroidetes bacterium GWA2_30_7]|nr:MAG: hypothetical protein A2046_14410 [Bacteroidetes bacterium GWA2_30_7]